MKKFKEWIKAINLPLFIDLLKWKLIDLYRATKHGKDIHLYGIWCFVGIYGGGKTMSLVEYLERMRQKHGDKIYIASNFFYKGQDFAIEKWQDLITEYDRPVIFAYDELQNEFNSREYTKFPPQLMTMLTQNRKGHGKQIVYTTQDYETVDKNFRRLTSQVVLCRTFLGRLTHTMRYGRSDYEQLINTANVDKKYKIWMWESRWYVQSDYLRDCYDSYQMLQTAKDKQYLGIGEMPQSAD